MPYQKTFHRFPVGISSPFKTQNSLKVKLQKLIVKRDFFVSEDTPKSFSTKLNDGTANN